MMKLGKVNKRMYIPKKNKIVLFVKNIKLSSSSLCIITHNYTFGENDLLLISNVN